MFASEAVFPPENRNKGRQDREGRLSLSQTTLALSFCRTKKENKNHHSISAIRQIVLSCTHVVRRKHTNCRNQTDRLQKSGKVGQEKKPNGGIKKKTQTLQKWTTNEVACEFREKHRPTDRRWRLSARNEADSGPVSRRLIAVWVIVAVVSASVATMIRLTHSEGIFVSSLICAAQCRDFREITKSAKAANGDSPVPLWATRHALLP